jgi:hypothetical protein
MLSAAQRVAPQARREPECNARRPESPQIVHRVRAEGDRVTVEAKVRRFVRLGDVRVPVRGAELEQRPPV